MSLKEKAPTRAQQLIYIAVDFLQKTDETIKDYMEKKNQHTSELSKLRFDNYTDTHHPRKYRHKRKKVKKMRKTKQRKKKKKTKKITPVPVLIQNNQNNLYNTSRTSENKQPFLTTSQPSFFNFLAFKNRLHEFNNLLEIMDSIDPSDDNPNLQINDTSNNYDNYFNFWKPTTNQRPLNQRDYFFQPSEPAPPSSKDKQFLHNIHFDSCGQTKLENDLLDLTLDF